MAGSAQQAPRPLISLRSAPSRFQSPARSLALPKIGQPILLAVFVVSTDVRKLTPIAPDRKRFSKGIGVLYDLVSFAGAWWRRAWQLRCRAGAGHSLKDRSMSVTPSAAAPYGFIVHSFAGNDFAECRDHVRDRLGLPTEYRPTSRPDPKYSPPLRPRPSSSIVQTQSHAGRMWREGFEPRG